MYGRGGELPGTSRDLYLKGCRILCEEVDPDRRETSRASYLTAEERLAIAARIAAITVFSNRDAVWTDVDAGGVPIDDVTVAAMVGGQETAGGRKFDVTDVAIRDTLATGLFSTRGAHRLGWSHATYAEFLAAHYVTQRGLSLPQLLNLTVHPDDPDGKLVPQLHETAGWMASMSPAFFQEVLQREPEVLLRSDVAAVHAADRGELVERLLDRADHGLFIDTDWGRRERYARLAHQGLPGQLRPYIEGRDKHVVARRVATDIAEACRLTGLQDLLAAIALNDSESLQARVNAAAAVKRMADQSVKLRLKPLIAGADPILMINCAQSAPDQLTAQELFAALTPPPTHNTSSTYRYFASEQVASLLSPSDLPSALEWVARQPARHQMAFGFDELVTKILVAAWAHIDAPEVLEAFAKAAFPRLRHHEGLFDTRTGAASETSAKLLADVDKRHRLVAALVRVLASRPFSLDPSKAGSYIASPVSRLVSSTDFRWLEDWFRSAKGTERDIWSEIIRLGIPWDNPKPLRRLVRLRGYSARLRAGIPIAILLLATYLPPAFRLYRKWRSSSWQRGLPKPKALKPPPAVRVKRRLRQCESGQSIAWWHLTREMTLEPTSTHYGVLEQDLTALPGWKTASPETRERILRAAERYLIEHEAQTSEWLGKNVIFWPAVAGYAALRLLQHEAVETFRALPPAVWSNWASIILAYPASAEPSDTELVQLALRNAPDSFTVTLATLIDVENRDDGRLHLLDRLGDAWTPPLAGALGAKLSDPALHVRAMGHLLDLLLDHDVPEGRSFAASLIAGASEQTGALSERVIAAGRALLTHASDGGWESIWPRFEQDPLFGEAVIAAMIDSHSVEDAISRRLTEEQLGSLYRWLARRYPHADDPHISGAHALGRREEIALWRDQILNDLRLRGTRAAYEALREIQRALPELRWLTWTLIEARDVMRRREWAAPMPGHVIGLTLDQAKRLVQSGRDLLDVLIESLRRLDQELHGETARAGRGGSVPRKRMLSPTS